MLRFLIALGLLALSATGALAQTPTTSTDPKPFVCPAGAAGQELLYFRGTSLSPSLNNDLHRVLVKYPPAETCGLVPPLEGLARDFTVFIPATYAAVQPFSTSHAIARRTDGVNVFIELATKAEKPFPYIRYLRVGDVGGFGVVSDDPATQTSTIVLLSRETAAPVATFERIIGTINTEFVGGLDFRNTAAVLRQRTEDGGERVLWVNRSGAINRITPPVIEMYNRNRNTRELVEIVGPSPFPRLWPEMFVPLQSSGERWPLPANVLGFGADPLQHNEQVTFFKRGDKTLIYTGASGFFTNPDHRRGWHVNPLRPDLVFEDMAVITPKQQPVAEYQADRFVVVRDPGASGWRPLRMELPSPDFVRPTPQAALDEAIIAYNARMAAGGLAQLAARQATEKAASDAALAKWQAERNAEAARYQALVTRAATPRANFLDDELRFAFAHEAATFKSDFQFAAPTYWKRFQGLKIANEVRSLGPQVHETSIWAGESRARTIGIEALRAFSQSFPIKDPQSRVMLCNSGQQMYCYQAPISPTVYQSAGFDGNVALANAAASTQAFIARERAINAANCARASMGAIIGCNR